GSTPTCDHPAYTDKLTRPNRRRWQSFDQLRLAIVSWIERTYHRRRRQARLGKLTPVEFEMVQSVQAAAAA
ncbi:IS3 family transposase, partial [Micrococcus luteus]|uniref:IS3 family transposase n=1 Tax=Micrococcus luteus TaxID=1270 RepID=UPI00351EB4B8